MGRRDMIDFFAQQERALTRSRWIAAAFAGSFFAVSLLLAVSTLYALAYAAEWGQIEALHHPHLLVTLSLLMPLLVLGGAALPLGLEMSHGLGAFLRSLGGHSLQEEANPQLRRLLSEILEEMSIASGIPPPELFLIDEKGINACSLGWSRHQAVIGLTRGAACRLSRDELQAVIAHEFSHLLHGDVRLNTRMLLWMAALEGCYPLGRKMLLGLFRRPPPGLAPLWIWMRILPFFLLGLICTALGALGRLLARVLQTAACRDRELVADATAIQLTRNPDGLKGAFLALGRNSLRARLSHSAFDALAHMLFADPKVYLFSEIFATHPPLADRIRATDPQWNGQFPDQPPPHRRFDKPDVIPEFLQAPAAETAAPAPALPAAQQTQSLGLLLRLFLSEETFTAHQQMDLIFSALPDISPEVSSWRNTWPSIPPERRLQLLELSLPALRDRPEDERHTLSHLLQQLVSCDGKLDMMELALLAETGRILSPSPPRHRPVRLSDHDAVILLLAGLAHMGNPDPDMAARCFRAGLPPLSGLFHRAETAPLPPAPLEITAMQSACEALATLSPTHQRRIFDACVAVVRANGQETTEETLALRWVAALLNLPVAFPGAAA